MKQKKKMTLHDYAVRLCEGGTIWFNQHQIRAARVLGPGSPCMMCEMDSICDDKFIDLCNECDQITHESNILILMDGK